MSAGNESNGRPSGSEGAPGVLANLPRTRPQRSTARRTAARRETAAARSAEARSADVAESSAQSGREQAPSRTPARKSSRARKSPAKGAAAAARKTAKGTARAAKTPTKSARSAPRHAASSAGEEQVPRQGFESEMDRASGPVQPPGGAELVTSAVEIVGELARAGLSRGERLLRDALDRLPLS
jgi:hypothetical protein